MSHHAEIIDEEKLPNGVSITIKVKIDGEKIGIPEADGEERTLKFTVPYKTYRNNEYVDRHVKSWAKHIIEQVKEEYQPTESAKGRTVEL